MARKRLLTILATAVAVMGLQMAPASALDIDLGAIGVSLSEDGLEATLGSEELAALEAKLGRDGLEAKLGDAEISTRDLLDELSSSSDGDEDAGSSDDKDESKEENEDKSKDKDDSAGESDSGASSTGSTDSSQDQAGDAASSDSSSDSQDREVTTAGGAESVDDANDGATADEGSDDGSSGPQDDVARSQSLMPDAASSGDADDDVTPAFDLDARDDADDVDIDDPIVAAPPTSGGDTHDWEPVAPGTERSDAELAAIPAGPPGGEQGAVPLGLKLVAGLLVAGTATVWHLARRELGAPVRLTPRA